jgi:hypothetical protein
VALPGAFDGEAAQGALELWHAFADATELVIREGVNRIPVGATTVAVRSPVRSSDLAEHVALPQHL